MAEFDSIKVKDQLGRPEDKGIFVKRKVETLVIDDDDLRLFKKSIGNSWIVGSPTNGIVGPNTNTVGGGQQVVGASERTINLRQSAGTIREWIVVDSFIDTDSTTANVDLNTHEITF